VAVVLPLALSGFPAPHVLLAFSTGMGAVVNSVLLFRGLRRAGVYHAAPGWRKFMLQVLIANLAMGAGLWWLGGGIDAWLGYGAWERALRLGACVLGGAAVYFAALWVVGLRYAELRQLAGK
jgi:putative peptidoglycan lipid II flippase